MKRKQFLQGILACTGLFVLILDGKTALAGARTGISLCLQVVIPSLFPFFLMTTLLTNALTGAETSVLRPIGKLFRMPPGTEAILVSGFLGGYPAGAQSIFVAWNAGSISKRNAERLLSFCNNAGPAFLFGMVSSAFPETWQTWALWGIHIFSAFLASRMIPAIQETAAGTKKTNTITLTAALQSSMRAMAMVCGWIVLFRVLIAFLDRWIFWFFPPELTVLLTGLLELSNGCCALSGVADVRIRFLICSMVLAFGGLCVTMQTASTVSGIPLGQYFLGKAIQVLFSLLISIAVMYQLYPIGILILLFGGYLLRNEQKKSSIPALVRV